MTEVILHGALGRKFGKVHYFNINKPIDAIRALMANKKGFRHALKAWGRKGFLYEMICNGNLIENEQELLNTQNIKRIELAPVILGASKEIKIVLGVILIVVGAIFIATGWLAPLGKFMVSMGVGLLIGGILEILFPVSIPSFHTEAAGRSFIFSTTGNSTTRGAPVQIGYGRLRVGSQVISTNLEPTRLGGGPNTQQWREDVLQGVLVDTIKRLID